MKTFKELKAAYQALMETSKVNTDKFQNKEITFDEWVKVYDAGIKKEAGWRRSLLTALAHLCEETYKEIAYRHASLDTLDLYHRYCRDY